jgi:hypothetical protein
MSAKNASFARKGRDGQGLPPLPEMLDVLFGAIPGWQIIKMAKRGM